MLGYLYAFFDTLLTRVFGHYAHPYLITLSVPASYMQGRMAAKEIKFIGSKQAAIELARTHMRAGRAVHARIQTRGGVLVWEGTS